VNVLLLYFIGQQTSPSTQPIGDPRQIYQKMANDVKEKGNEAHKNGHHEEAIQCYTNALALANQTLHLNNVDTVDTMTFAQLYSNRSLVLSLTGDNSRALEDARECINYEPEWFKVRTATLVGCDFLFLHTENITIGPLQNFFR
jgi:tetratricopeptide (TPR) repeat protein